MGASLQQSEHLPHSLLLVIPDSKSRRLLRLIKPLVKSGHRGREAIERDVLCRSNFEPSMSQLGQKQT
jgi:hypothetical protein